MGAVNFAVRKSELGFLAKGVEREGRRRSAPILDATEGGSRVTELSARPCYLPPFGFMRSRTATFLLNML